MNYILLIVGIILFNEIIRILYRQYNRKKIFRLSLEHSKKVNKPLVVIGDPYSGKGSTFFNNFMSSYGCGDETVDLTGAPKCPNGIKSDLLDYLKKKNSNSCIIFISCVLEYIDNIEETINELYRVGGSPSNIFVVCVGDYSLSSYFYKEDDHSSKNIIYAKPGGKIEYKKI
jgi:hypothetical protein